MGWSQFFSQMCTTNIEAVEWWRTVESEGRNPVFPIILGLDDTSAGGRYFWLSPSDHPYYEENGMMALQIATRYSYLYSLWHQVLINGGEYFEDIE
jgi:hypothetical protein